MAALQPVLGEKSLPEGPSESVFIFLQNELFIKSESPDALCPFQPCLYFSPPRVDGQAGLPML